MSGRGLIALLTVLIVIAAPAATALADGAGDEQYQDPLTAPSAPHKKKTRKSTTTAPAATTAPASTVAATTQTAAATTTQAPAAELPRTGAPAGLIALAGAAMISAGLALRRRIAQP